MTARKTLTRLRMSAHPLGPPRRQHRQCEPFCLSVAGLAPFSRILGKEGYDHEKLLLRNYIAKTKNRGFRPSFSRPTAVKHRLAGSDVWSTYMFTQFSKVPQTSPLRPIRSKKES